MFGMQTQEALRKLLKSGYTPNLITDSFRGSKGRKIKGDRVCDSSLYEFVKQINIEDTLDITFEYLLAQIQSIGDDGIDYENLTIEAYNLIQCVKYLKST